MNNSYDDVCAALTQLTTLLHDGLKLEQRRRDRDGEIKSREGSLRTLDVLRRHNSREPWQNERLKMLADGEEADKQRLEELFEERRQHEQLTERLLEAEHILFRFADGHGIDTDPLRRLLMDGNLECAETVIPTVRRLAAALDRESEAGAGDKQTPEQMPLVGTPFDEEDVPAWFRESGKPDGAVLTAPYLADNLNWYLKGSYLTKHFGEEPDKELKHRIKVGSAFAYCDTELLILRDRKTGNMAKREEAD